MDLLIRTLAPFFRNQFFLTRELEKLLGGFMTNAKKYLDNPYSLVYETKLGFTEIDSYANTLQSTNGEPKYSEYNIERIEAAAYSVLNMIERGIENEDLREKTYLDKDEIITFEKMLLEDAGSSCISSDRLFTYVELLLSLQEEIPGEITYEVLRELILTQKIRTLKIDGTTFVFRKERFLAEYSTAEIIKEKFLRPFDTNNADVFTAIEKSMAKNNLMLSREQKLAVKTALTNRISIITGGPGTGKSATQKILLDTYLSLYNGNIRLVAPTGQAAKRMREATGFPASTIHSALGLRPNSLSKTVKDITEGLVVVDEASMIDEDVFLKLITAISSDSILVIVGDVDQLPSIGCGNILSELINSEVISTTKLTKIFRQKDNSIAFNAAKMKVGNASLDYDDKFNFLEIKGSKNIANKAVEIYKTEFEKGNKDCIILTPFRRNTETGVNELNRKIRKALMDTKELPYVKVNGNTEIYLHDKVMYLVNKNGLVNGEVGVVTNINREDDTITVSFSEKTLVVPKEEWYQLIPAYAQTIHKSQGLEFDTVIVICDPLHEKMLSREILYTGISRSKNMLYCIGDKDVLDNSILQEPKIRNSGLKKFMRA